MSQRSLKLLRLLSNAYFSVVSLLPAMMEDSEKSVESNFGGNSLEGDHENHFSEEPLKNNNENGKKSSLCKVRYNRIFKKVSSDGNLVLFLPQRELAVSENNVESLMGVALIHENVMKVADIKVFLQVVLVFR